MLKICNSMYEVQEFLKGHCFHCNPNEVLCGFDIAETMITCSHPASYPGNRNKYQSELETIKSNYDVFDFVHFVTSTYPSQIFDDTLRYIKRGFY